VTWACNTDGAHTRASALIPAWPSWATIACTSVARFAVVSKTNISVFA